MAAPAGADRRDIQGLVYSGYGHLPHAAYLFVTLVPGEPARGWLADVVGQVATAEEYEVQDAGRGPEKVKPDHIVNVGISASGLTALGLPGAALDTFPKEFVFGMAERAIVLGDHGPSAPENWEFGGPDSPVDAVLLVLGRDRETLDGAVAAARARYAGRVHEVAAETGARLEQAKEHFGFRDGLSQPHFAGTPSAGRIRAGEFVLGYPNEYGVLPATPGLVDEHAGAVALPAFPGLAGHRDLGRNGTYLVYRKLEQDVAGFWNYVDAQAGGDPVEMQLIAAKLVGRWPSGAPLTLAPDRDDPELAADRSRNNAFMFAATDAAGIGCPVGSHIRRSNPRDVLQRNSPEEALKTVNRHRILRRGMPYGPPLFGPDAVAPGRAPRGLEPDGERRGLHFFCINTSISNQFEFITQQWCNAAGFEAMQDCKDPIVGDNDGSTDALIPRATIRRRIRNVPRFVTVKAGGYFFLASRTTLAYLAAG